MSGNQSSDCAENPEDMQALRQRVEQLERRLAKVEGQRSLAHRLAQRLFEAVLFVWQVACFVLTAGQILAPVFDALSGRPPSYDYRIRWDLFWLGVIGFIPMIPALVFYNKFFWARDSDTTRG